jgi:apolipoprotein N-acyltransferase
VAVVVSGHVSTRPRRIFALGLLAGFIYFLGTTYWVTGVMATFGEFPIVVAVGIAVMMSAYLAIYPAMFALILARAVRRFGLGAVWCAPLFWVATEWVRASIGGGFPWVLLGSSQASVIPVVQFASVAGVFGLSALVALVGTAAAIVALTRRRAHVIGAIGVIAVLVAIAIGGAMRVASSRLTQQGTPMRVGLLQGNVAQDLKYNPASRDSILKGYLDLSQQTVRAGANLVIWPEASMPFYFNAESVLAAPVRQLAVLSRVPFLIGTDDYELGTNGQPNRIYNSAVLLGADGRSHATYRKMRLVPFGEYVPMKSLLFFVGPLVQAVSDFTPGDEPVVFDDAGRRFSVSICYESVYPWISRAFVQHGSELLATITNDAWFGRSSAAYQHWEQGAIRAVEEGRYVVRAANTGFSGAVDPYGRVLAKSELFTTDAVTVDVRLLDGATLYNRLGDLVAYLALVVTGVLMLLSRRPRQP